MADDSEQKNSWLKFYMSDWRADPAVRMCSLAARGLWMEMLCLMHEANPYGSLLINKKQITPRQLSSLVGSNIKEVDTLISELEEAGVFSRDPDKTIYNRRMRRDAAKAARNADAGKSGGNPEIRRGSVPKDQRIRPYKRSDAPAKTKRIFEREGGKCHWCGIPLAWEYTDGAANYFQVDHVVAICDGGTNDESNLVAACAACNHKRARNAHPTATGYDIPTPCPTPTTVTVGSNSDTMSDTEPDGKAYMPYAIFQKENPAPTESVTASAAAERAGAAKRFEFSVDDNPDDSYRNAEHACIAALGGSPAQGGIAPTDAVFHPIMSLIKQGIALDSIVMVLREMAKKPPHEPIRTWKLFASKVVKKLESLPKITLAAATVDIRGIKVPEQRVVEYIKKYRETGKWPENWGLPPDHPNTSIPARLREPQVAN